MNKLKAALAKDAKDLTDAEKSVITKHWDLLNSELRAKFADAAPEDADEDEDAEEDTDADAEEGIDAKTLEKLVGRVSAKQIDAKIEEMAKTIVGSLADKVEDGRKQFAATGIEAAGKSREDDEVTRKFVRALMSKDVATLKELGKREKAIDTTSDGTGADAGYLIPQPLENAILRVTPAGYGLAKQIFAYNLITQGNSKRVTALGSSLSVFWADEGEKKPASQPTFKLVTLVLKKLVVIVPMTEEAVDDAGINLTELVAQLIAEAIDKEVDLQFFMGDGTVWTGIFNDSTITSQAVTGTTGTGMAKLRPEDVISLADNTPLSVGGSYLMGRSVLSAVRTLRQNADGTGNYLYNPLGDGGGASSPFNAGTLNGYPVILAEAAPTAASAVAGAKPIMMFGDFKRGVAYGEKSGVQLKLLDQATITDVDGETTINLAEQDMIAMRAVQRVGMKVTLAGAMRRLVTV